MSKRSFIITCIIVIVFSGMIFYFNSEKIISFFENKEWEIADSIGSVYINNFSSAESTNSNLFLIGSNYIKGYSNEAKEIMDIFLPFSDTAYSSAGEYIVVGEKNGQTIYLISSGQKVWEKNIIGNIYDVYVNKNGYVAVIYKQSGYKSLVKLFSSTGEELFTSFLATTYAVDVAITNDNKKLAIAEVDTEGIHVVSSIKIIDVNNLTSEDVKKITLDDNSLVLELEYGEKNELIVRTDKKIQKVVNNIVTDIVSYDYSNTIWATIQNGKNGVLVNKEENGLFDEKYKLSIYSEQNKEITKKEYELYGIPNKIKTCSDVIVLVMEKELLVINTSGRLVKKFDISGNVRDIAIFDNSNMVGVIFRDRVEFVRI